VEGLKLDSDAVANIFLGKITSGRSRIKALNPDAKLPSTPSRPCTVRIPPAHQRLHSYLAAVNADWKAGPGAGKEIKWTGGVGGKGNDGVAAVVKQTEGAIGYVELAYATQNKMTMADVKNKSGKFITPSLESTSAAAEASRSRDMNCCRWLATAPIRRPIPL